jgi:serine/threonine-protein kinase HipA
MLLLARECGINAAASKVERVGNCDVLLVKRFDREPVADGYLRMRMISALTLLRAEDNVTDRRRWSYLDLVEELRRISAKPQEDAHELFRRMVFNALISNSDDHLRNHALLAHDDWRLSPAYDLTPTPLTSTERRDLALTCGEAGRWANAANLLSQCQRFLLNHDQAQAIVESMTQIVKNSWYRCAREAGLSEQDCQSISPAFVYPGFLSGILIE